MGIADLGVPATELGWAATLLQRAPSSARRWWSRARTAVRPGQA